MKIGCYIDGAYQSPIEGDARLVRLTEELGRVLDRDARNFCLRVEHDVTTDRDCDDSYAIEATDWLFDNHPLPYAYWGWEDGSFGLWPDVDGAKEDVGFVSSKRQEYPEDDFEGEWLHVNDHGNATLYVRTAGEDTEVWSVC